MTGVNFDNSLGFFNVDFQEFVENKSTRIFQFFFRETNEYLLFGTDMEPLNIKSRKVNKALISFRVPLKILSLSCVNTISQKKSLKGSSLFLAL